MRELTVRVDLPVAPAVALRLMYDDAGAFFAKHHSVCSNDAGARVSRWEPATRTRTVSFLKRLDMPAALAKVFGARGAALRCMQRPGAVARCRRTHAGGWRSVKKYRGGPRRRTRAPAARHAALHAPRRLRPAPSLRAAQAISRRWR
jgi:hypothetical protein